MNRVYILDNEDGIMYGNIDFYDYVIEVNDVEKSQLEMWFEQKSIIYEKIEDMLITKRVDLSDEIKKDVFLKNQHYLSNKIDKTDVIIQQANFKIGQLSEYFNMLCKYLNVEIEKNKFVKKSKWG